MSAATELAVQDEWSQIAAVLYSDEHERHHAMATTRGEHYQAVTIRMKGVEWLIAQGLACPRVLPTPRKEYPPAPQGIPPRGKGLAIVGVVGDAPREAARPRPMLCKASQIEAKTQEWLWPGRFPRGSVAIIAGNMGVGKSTFIGSMVATVTSGGRWPDGPTPVRPGSVIYIQDEESLASMQRPRLERFGADLDKVAFLTGLFRGGDVELPFSIARDVDALDVACDELGDVSMVLIDPIGSFLTGISGYCESETREAVGPLFRFAERRNVAVVAVAHLNKDAEKPIQSRISGTFALPAKGRMVWYLSQDPANRKRRLLSLLKGNLDGKTETALGFSYRGGRIVWHPKPIALDAGQVDNLLRQKALDERLGLRTEARQSKLPATKLLLLTILAAGPIAPEELYRKATGMGTKESTYRKALSELLDEGRLAKEGDPEQIRVVPPVEPATEAPAGPAEEPTDDVVA